MTDFHSWMDLPKPVKGVERVPKLRSRASDMEGPAVAAKAIRSQAAAQSHNVFRPDIYRVSEGYLN